MMELSAKEKRKRGPNYTEAEKENLRFLAKRFNNIIESKSTGSKIFQQKAEAWAQLAKSYNACSTSGIRTAEQLKHSYENMKQGARKALASSNKADYLRKMETAEVKSLKLLDQTDKVARKKTGGGSFTPAIQDKDLKVLALIKDQVEPLSSPFDSAASYFNDLEITVEPEEEENMVVVEVFDENQESEQANRIVVEVFDENQESEQAKLTTTRSDALCENLLYGGKPKGCINKKIKCRKQMTNRKETRGGIATANLKKTPYYKNAYFKKKFENSILEKRRLYQEIRIRQKEHEMFTKKHKLEMSILEKQEQLLNRKLELENI